MRLNYSKADCPLGTQRDFSIVVSVNNGDASNVELQFGISWVKKNPIPYLTIHYFEEDYYFIMKNTLTVKPLW